MARKTTLQGGKLMVFIGSATYDLAKSCKLTLTNEITDEATKDDGIWGFDEITKKSWSVSCEGNLNTTDPVYATIVSAWLAGTALTLKIAVPSNYSDSGLPASGWTAPSSGYLSGTAVIESVDLDGTKGSAGTYSVNFKGKGAISSN